MNVFTVLLAIYLLIGFIYATYILLFGQDYWYYFLINWLLGPITLLYNVYFTYSGKSLGRQTLTNGSLLKDIKAVVFDLDNTIIDTQDIWDDSIRAVITALKIDLDEEDLANIDLGPEGITIYNRWQIILSTYPEIGSKYNYIDKLIASTNEQFMKIFKNRIEEKTLDIKDGLWGMLNELKGTYKMQVALATNTEKSLAEQMLKIINLDTAFDFYTYGDEITDPKPAPEIYFKTAKKLKVNPTKLLVFEDSVTGIRSALDAGAKVVIINERLPEENYDIKRVLGTFASFKEPTLILGKSYTEYKSEQINQELPTMVKKLKEVQDTIASTKSTN